MIETERENAIKISRGLHLFHGKWTIEILYAMRYGPVRLGQLKRSIPMASKKALTASLRKLAEAKIIERRDLSSSVLHVEYALSERFQEPITSLLGHLDDWASHFD